MAHGEDSEEHGTAVVAVRMGWNRSPGGRRLMTGGTGREERAGDRH
jgi:hypothetical protein